MFGWNRSIWDDFAMQGRFTVTPEECIACRAPESVAPNLIGFDEVKYQCYWRKQPETDEEVSLAIEAVRACCCGNHRYEGNDELIRERIEAQFPTRLSSRWWERWLARLTGLRKTP